jgi:hypothetical protein
VGREIERYKREREEEMRKEHWGWEKLLVWNITTVGCGRMPPIGEHQRIYITLYPDFHIIAPSPALQRWSYFIDYLLRLKGQCHEIFDPRFLTLKQYPLGPWFTSESLFEFCLEFAEIWSIFERKNRFVM